MTEADRAFRLRAAHDALPEDIVGELRERLRIADGPVRSVRQTWLDTFDWRLHRAGLSLWYETTGRTGTLTLATVDGERIAGQVAPVAWPCRWEELPTGAVRDRLRPVIGLRALLPVTRLAGRVTELRVLNSDDKTVARISLRRPSTTTRSAAADRGEPARQSTAGRGEAGRGDAGRGTAGRDAAGRKAADRKTVGPEAVGTRTVGRGAAVAPEPPAPLLLTLTAVRGYGKIAERIARSLAALPGLTPEPRSDLRIALAAAGLVPGRGKAEPRLTPSMPADVAMATILSGLLDTVETNVDGVVGDLDTEFLHDLRIAVRRARSALKAAGDVLAADPTAVLASELKWLGDLTTPVRDLDVNLLGRAEQAGWLRAMDPADLGPYHDHLVGLRGAARRRLVRGLRSTRFAEVTAGWRASVTGVLDASPAQARAKAGEDAATLAAVRIRRAHRRVIRRGSAITPTSPAEDLHDLRKRVKELRYLLEFFGSLQDPDLNRDMIKECKALLDCLGEFQDNEVQAAQIRRFAEQMAEAGTAPTATLLAMGELAGQLAERQHQARAAFAARFARFTRSRNGARMNRLTASASR